MQQQASPPEQPRPKLSPPPRQPLELLGQVGARASERERGEKERERARERERERARVRKRERERERERAG
jgi:hypothetical protein